MFRVQNAGDALTSRQRKLHTYDADRAQFKDAFDVFLHVSAFQAKFPPNEDDWLCKAALVEQGMYARLPPHHIRFNLHIPCVLDGERAIETQAVDVAKLLRDLPRSVLACCVQYDPPAEDEAHLTPSDLTPVAIDCPSFPDHMMRCAELIVILTHALVFGPDSRQTQLTAQEWINLRKSVMQMPSWDPETPVQAQPAPQVLSELLDATTAVLVKLLGTQREQFVTDLVTPDGNAERALKRINLVMLLVIACEKLCLLTAMEVHGVSTHKNLPAPLGDHAFHHFFHRQPAAIEAMTNILRFGALMYRIFRERCLEVLAPAGAAPAAAVTRHTSAVALRLALTVEVIERLLQSRPMAEVLAASGADGLTLEALRFAKAGLALLSPDADGQGRQLYCEAFSKPADSATLLLFPTSRLNGDVELLIARALMLFAELTKCLAPRLAQIGAPTDSTTKAWWSTALDSWFVSWMTCSYYALDLAERVLTRRPPVAGSARPAPLQSHEGQLSINAMRAASAVCATRCRALLPGADAAYPFAAVRDKAQKLVAALRYRLFQTGDKMASLLACGEQARALFDSEQFTIFPASCKLHAFAAYTCFEGVDMTEYVQQEFFSDPALRGRQRKPSHKEMLVLLQSVELSVHTWRVLQGLLGVQTQDGTWFEQTEMAHLVEGSMAKLANGPTNMWAKMAPKVLQNLESLSEQAKKVDQYLGKVLPRYESQFEPRVVSWFNSYFQAKSRHWHGTTGTSAF